jgi:hypothetical protein
MDAKSAVRTNARIIRIAASSVEDIIELVQEFLLGQEQDETAGLPRPSRGDFSDHTSTLPEKSDGMMCPREEAS